MLMEDSCKPYIYILNPSVYNKLKYQLQVLVLHFLLV